MERRRPVALIAGLVLRLALLGVTETLDGSRSITVQLQADQHGVSYLPSGLAGSSLRIFARGYQPIDITDWNGQQLDLSLQRDPLQ